MGHASVLCLPAAAAACPLGLVGVVGFGLVENGEDRAEPAEDVPGLVEVAKLLAQQQPGPNGGGAREAGMDVGLDASLVLHAAVGPDPGPVQW